MLNVYLTAFSKKSIYKVTSEVTNMRYIDYFLRAIHSVYFPIRRRQLVKRLMPELKNATTVLDIGCYDGRLSAVLQQKGQHFVGVDTVKSNKNYIPIVLYKGKRLPFKNNQFETTLLIDVLHHTTDSLSLLQEARRVTRNKIIIKDHYYHYLFQNKLLKLFDYLGNKPYNIALPYNFLNLDSWQQLIKSSKLTIGKMHTFHTHLLHPINQVLYVLKK
ncbi:hypothetical protein CL622_03860 [archaeon]|nr:hypothetical protein [archaeon]|tara:strand:+ start:66 stop:716 length:651 start_codon:yes stop_codon:yes gene_type:complete